MTDKRLHDVAQLSSRVGFKNYCMIAHRHSPTAKIIIQYRRVAGEFDFTRFTILDSSD